MIWVLLYILYIIVQAVLVVRYMPGAREIARDDRGFIAMILVLGPLFGIGSLLYLVLDNLSKLVLKIAQFKLN